MAWRVAKSLDKLLAQINAQYPGRDKSWDGGIGDEDHASRSSDHNPWVKDGKTGIVTARDFTHDPRHGLNSETLAELLRASRDVRIKYIISNQKICAGEDGPTPWQWRHYTGKNHHDHHCHISVKADKADYDDTTPWELWDTVASSGDEDSHSDAHMGELIEMSAKSIDPDAKADKTVVVARTAAATTAAIPVIGATVSAVVEPSNDVVEQVTSVIDKSGDVIGKATKIIAVPKPGFWPALLHTITTPGFLIAVIVLMALAWAFVWAWQRQHSELQTK